MSLRNQCVTSLYALLKEQDTVAKEEALQRLLSDGHDPATAKKMATKGLWILRDEEIAVYADLNKKLHKWTGKERPVKADKKTKKKVVVVDETPAVVVEESAEVVVEESAEVVVDETPVEVVEEVESTEVEEVETTEVVEESAEVVVEVETPVEVEEEER